MATVRSAATVDPVPPAHSRTQVLPRRPRGHAFARLGTRLAATALLTLNFAAPRLHAEGTNAPGAESNANVSPPPPPLLPATLGDTGILQWRRQPPESTDPAKPPEAGIQPRLVLVSPVFNPPTPWNELVVSWNVAPPDGAGLHVEAQALFPDRESAFFSLGHWAPETNGVPWTRTSDVSPRDPDGRVKTDTLALRNPATAARLRITLAGTLAEHPERLRRVALSFSDTRSRPLQREPDRRAWGTTLDVPERSQIAHPGGEVWCSPTCISMTLAWWASRLSDPSLDRSVPEAAAAVHDPGWPGTGNWSFNVAFAGSFAPLAGVATRLPDLRAVEELIAAGIPVALSVNAPALRGESGRENGHLILAVGFTADGDVVANDPYAREDRGQRVRRVYRRANVLAAWDNSHRLAYVIAPASDLQRLPVAWR